MTFTPTATGTRTGTISVVSNALSYSGGPSSTILLQGTSNAGAEAPTVTLSPSPVNYNNVTVATTSAAQTVTLVNTGTVNFTLRRRKLQCNPDSRRLSGQRNRVG